METNLKKQFDAFMPAASNNLAEVLSFSATAMSEIGLAGAVTQAAIFTASGFSRFKSDAQFLSLAKNAANPEWGHLFNKFGAVAGGFTAASILLSSKPMVAGDYFKLGSAVCNVAACYQPEFGLAAMLFDVGAVVADAYENHASVSQALVSYAGPNLLMLGLLGLRPEQYRNLGEGVESAVNLFRNDVSLQHSYALSGRNAHARPNDIPDARTLLESPMLSKSCVAPDKVGGDDGPDLGGLLEEEYESRVRFLVDDYLDPRHDLHPRQFYYGDNLREMFFERFQTIDQQDPSPILLQTLVGKLDLSSSKVEIERIVDALARGIDLKAPKNRGIIDWRQVVDLFVDASGSDKTPAISKLLLKVSDPNDIVPIFDEILKGSDSDRIDKLLAQLDGGIVQNYHFAILDDTLIHLFHASSRRQERLLDIFGTGEKSGRWVKVLPELIGLIDAADTPENIKIKAMKVIRLMRPELPFYATLGYGMQGTPDFLHRRNFEAGKYQDLRYPTWSAVGSLLRIIDDVAASERLKAWAGDTLLSIPDVVNTGSTPF